MPYNYASLNPTKALIWRIVHRDNLEWILLNGLHCGNGFARSPDWVSIGNEDLISKRANHPVPRKPGGMLGDYVPFYFTPFSVMMQNIHTGWGGIKKRTNDEIIILVSSLRHIHATGLTFLFTDSHAYYPWTNFYNNLSDLTKIDWPLLQRRDFKRDPDDPAKFERYQAEALIHQHCPIEGLQGVICYTQTLRKSIEDRVKTRGLDLAVHARPDWYF